VTRGRASREQTEQYALPDRYRIRPTFLVVVDVRHTIGIYAEFTQNGGTYAAFPDQQTNRINRDAQKEFFYRMLDISHNQVIRYEVFVCSLYAHKLPFPLTH